MFFLKKQLNTLNLFFSKKARNALFFYNLKVNKNLINIKKNKNILINIKKNKNILINKTKNKNILNLKYLINRKKKKKISNLKFLINKKKNKEKKKGLNSYFTELLCQLKKNNSKFKRKKIFKNLVTISKNALNTRHSVFLFRKIKIRKNRRNYGIKEKILDPIYTASLINLLKIKTKFQYVRKTGLKYCKLFFKYTGSNFFGTITDAKGNVFFSYSSGIFSGLNTRKEKTTIFVVKQLGELLSLRIYKSNVGEIIFVPLINHKKIKTLLRFLISGFREMRLMNFVKILPKRKVMRNGVRLKKVARK